jgi:hypothetical protein
MIVVWLVALVVGVVIVGKGVEEGLESAKGLLVTIQGTNEECDVARRMQGGMGQIWPRLRKTTRP